MNNTKTNKVVVRNITQTSAVKSTQLVVPLTDSARIVKHLDSLPNPTFPLVVSDWNGTPTMSLSDFKAKKLFKLRYKLIPRAIGGAGIDDDNGIDSTFNLCDTDYKASWSLVAKTPKFFVIEVDDNYSLLVTIDYQLNVIDAIHVAAADPLGNDHFHGELTSTIYKNLKIVMHYDYSQQAGAEEGYAASNEMKENDIWRIDKTGHFKAIRYRPDGGNSDF
jgi:hypothetical protein